MRLVTGQNPDNIFARRKRNAGKSINAFGRVPHVVMQTGAMEHNLTLVTSKGCNMQNWKNHIVFRGTWSECASYMIRRHNRIENKLKKGFRRIPKTTK